MDDLYAGIAERRGIRQAGMRGRRAVTPAVVVMCALLLAGVSAPAVEAGAVLNVAEAAVGALPLIPVPPVPPVVSGPGQPVVPNEDPFYRPVSDVEGAQPGQVLRQRRSQVRLGVVPVPVSAWQLLYRSTTALGEPDAVSGTVLVPATGWTGRGARPLVSYAVGTHGLADRCAPSYELAAGTESEVVTIAQALGRGWAVAVTDYEGLGTPGQETLGVQRSEGHAVLDAVRAAIQLPGTGLSETAPVGIWGYSEGGGAAGMAAELAHEYAPELHTVGVAEGGTPADLREVATSFNNAPAGFSYGFVPAAFAGYLAAYPDVGLGSLLKPAGRALVEQVRGECLEFLVSGAGRYSADYFTTTNPFTYPPLASRLADNSLGSRAPDMPVFIYHALQDEFIPFDQAQRLFRRYCAAKAGPVRFLPLPGEHLSTQFGVGGTAAVAWLAARFAHDPAPTSCHAG